MIRSYIAYDPTTGEIVRKVTCPEEIAELQFQAGEQWIEADASPETHYVKDGAVVAYTDQQREAKAKSPPFPARWSNTEMRWIDLRSLEQVKADCWAAIKAQRNAAEWGGFDTPFGRFDSDPNSQTKIIGTAQLASIALAQGAPFNVEWTLQDNTSVSLDATQMIAVGAALAAHVDAVHQRGRQLRAQIEAATTLADLEGISWTP